MPKIAAADNNLTGTLPSGFSEFPCLELMICKFVSRDILLLCWKSPSSNVVLLKSWKQHWDLMHCVWQFLPQAFITSAVYVIISHHCRGSRKSKIESARCCQWVTSETSHFDLIVYASISSEQICCEFPTKTIVFRSNFEEILRPVVD